MNTAKSASVFISHKRSKSPGGSSCLPPSKPAFQVKSSAERRVISAILYYWPAFIPIQRLSVQENAARLRQLGKLSSKTLLT
jgi:hypothetical protein